MKKNIFQIAFIALVAGLSVVSCQKVVDQDDKIETPVLVSISADKLFVSGSATITASLNTEAKKDVTVNLTTSDKVAQTFTTPIPEEFITLGTITIPAGQKEATTTISVDASTFEKGKYETQVLVTGANGANVSSSNKANIVLLVGESVATVAFGDYLDEYGEGTFTVSLDMFSETDCEVTLDYYAAAPTGFVPLYAIEMDKKVVIKAGETEATGTISVDLDALDANQFWYVGVVITGISEGPFEFLEKPTYSGIDFTIPVNKTSDWVLDYVDKEYYEGESSEVFFQNSLTSPYFKYYVTSVDYWDEDLSNNFVYPEFIAYVNNYLSQYSKYPMSVLVQYGIVFDSSKSHYFAADNKAAGKYRVWIVGVGEDCAATGEFAVAEFEVVDDTPEYAAWLGKWVIGSTNEDEEPVVISINTASQNEAYSIDGLEGLDTSSNMLTALGFINEDSGALEMYSNSQFYGLKNLWYQGEDENQYADVLLGVYADGTPSIASLNTPLATVMFGADGNGYFTPGMDNSFKAYIATKYCTIDRSGNVVDYLSDVYTWLKGETLVPYVEPEPEPNPTAVDGLLSGHGYNPVNPKRIDRETLAQIRNK